jgi:DNA-binding CsgD family transcriptional regulator
VGERADMAATLAASEAELRRSAMRLDLAWTLFERGAAARRAGRRTEAREPLREALDLAGRLGAERLAVLVRDELLAAGARPQRAALSGPEALTPSERRVAELAATGLSNREVAETLWVTRKTVELHLGRSYAKLGIRSRAQLAAALGG